MNKHTARSIGASPEKIRQIRQEAREYFALAFICVAALILAVLMT